MRVSMVARRAFSDSQASLWKEAPAPSTTGVAKPQTSQRQPLKCSDSTAETTMAAAAGKQASAVRYFWYLCCADLTSPAGEAGDSFGASGGAHEVQLMTSTVMSEWACECCAEVVDKTAPPLAKG